MASFINKRFHYWRVLIKIMDDISAINDRISRILKTLVLNHFCKAFDWPFADKTARS